MGTARASRILRVKLSGLIAILKFKQALAQFVRTRLVALFSMVLVGRRTYPCVHSTYAMWPLMGRSWLRIVRIYSVHRH